MISRLSSVILFLIPLMLSCNILKSLGLGLGGLGVESSSVEEVEEGDEGVEVVEVKAGEERVVVGEGEGVEVGEEEESVGDEGELLMSAVRESIESVVPWL